LRLLVLLSGGALLVIAIAYLLLEEALAVFTIPVAAIVILIGLILAPSPKVTGGNLLGDGPLIVDRAVLGTSIYQLFFFDTRLILKRLATAKTTIFTVLVLSLAGLVIDRLIGALAGVAVGYAMQEYTTQSAREKPPVSNSTLKIGPNDVEVPYDELEKVVLDGNKLVLFSKRGITRLGMSRGYATVMAPTLTTLFQNKFTKTGSVHSTDASRKQNN